MALAQATKEAIWIQRFLEEIGMDSPTEIVIYSDNQSAISLAKNSVHHARTKHIDIRHHFLREKIESGELEVKFCGTETMMADVPKGLAREKHCRFSSGMDMWEFSLEKRASGGVVEEIYATYRSGSVRRNPIGGY